METTIIRKSADPFSAAVLRGERSSFEGAIMTLLYCPACRENVTKAHVHINRKGESITMLPLPDCRHGVNRALGYTCRTCDMEAVDGTYSLPPMREIR
jgi:hypothetical protein